MLPIVAALLKVGLPILGNAVLNKGQEAIEEKLGVKLPEVSEILGNPDTVFKLRELELTHEESLLTNALENRKIDLEEYKTEIADRDSARKKEVAIAQTSGRPWWVPSFLDILTLVVVVGGAWILLQDMGLGSELRYAVVGQIASVLAYHFGTTRRSGVKDVTIQHLASKEK